MAVEDLFAREADLHRAVEQQRRLRDDDLVVERIALAAEAAAVRRRDDADVGGRHGQRLGERAVDVVRRLRRGPEHELAVGILRRDGGVLLDRQVRVALIEEGVLEHAVGVARTPARRRRTRSDTILWMLPRVAVLVDARLGVGEALLRIAEGAQRLVLDVDQVERLECRQLVAGDDGRDRIADEAHAIDRERMLVLADRQDAVGDGEVLAGQRQVDARMRQRARHVDAEDARVRHRRAQQLAVHHPRQHHVVGEPGLAGDLRAPVDAAAGRADDVHRGSPLG